jgi:hypothetical protein
VFPNALAESVHSKIFSKLEDAEAPAKLALLIYFADYAAATDLGGTENNLERLMWRGIETLGREILHDFEELQQIAGTESEFVTIHTKRAPNVGALLSLRIVEPDPNRAQTGRCDHRVVSRAARAGATA